MKNEMKEFCKSLGLELVGFAKCRILKELEGHLEQRKKLGHENEFEEQSILKRTNPFLLMEDGKTIISIAFPYSFDSSKSTGVHFSKYTRGADYHMVASRYLEKICSFIEEKGGKAMWFADSNCLPERYLAMMCGIGFIGKNNMIITEKYGSYVFLGEIITDLEIEEDNPKKSMCGDCSICLNACPTKSITEGCCNANICLSYITQKKEIGDEWLLKFNGRLFGCDTCQNVCPYNRKVEMSPLDEFRPFEFMEQVNLQELITMSNSVFKEKYKNTSCGWRGKNVISRNALINCFKSGEASISSNDISSNYVKNYYNRLLSLLDL